MVYSDPARHGPSAAYRLVGENHDRRKIRQLDENVLKTLRSR